MRTRTEDIDIRVSICNMPSHFLRPHYVSNDCSDLPGIRSEPRTARSKRRGACPFVRGPRDVLCALRVEPLEECDRRRRIERCESCR